MLLRKAELEITIQTKSRFSESKEGMNMGLWPEVGFRILSEKLSDATRRGVGIEVKVIEKTKEYEFHMVEGMNYVKTKLWHWKRMTGMFWELVENEEEKVDELIAIIIRGNPEISLISEMPLSISLKYY